MEEPVITLVRPASSRLHTFLHRPSERTLLITAVALTVVVYVVAMLASLPWVVFAVSTHNTRFETIQGGLPTWYESKFGAITRVSGPKGFEKAPVTVLEVATTDTPSGNRIVLAHVEGVEGVVIGILHQNNSFETVLADGTNKANLALRPDGVALYEAFIQGEAHLMRMDIAHQTSGVKDLGKGKSPRLYPDGSFVAITPDGVIRIDPETQSTTVLIPSSFAYKWSGTIRLDGKEALVPNGAGKTVLFELEKTSPSNISIVRTLHDFSSNLVSLVGGNYVVVPDAKGNLQIYTTNTSNHFIGALPVS